MTRTYSLKTVKEVYSASGKHPFVYKMVSALMKPEHWMRWIVIKRAGLKKGDRVLDIACGTGLNFKHIMKAIGNSGSIVGVDYVKEMADASRKLAKKKAWKNVSIIQADAAKLGLEKSLKPHSFDAVVSTIGFSAIPDHLSALKHAKTLLKRSKKLVILDGKYFNERFSFLNFIVDIARWTKSYDPNKDIIGDIKRVFGNVRFKEYLLGTDYIAEAVKR